MKFLTFEVEMTLYYYNLIQVSSQNNLNSAPVVLLQAIMVNFGPASVKKMVPVA